MANFEQELYAIVAQLKSQMRASPLFLGGVSTSGGGAGGPPGGFVGYLPQTRVTYDMAEVESNATVVSATLLDNMNHIRYRLEQLESTPASGIGHVIQNTGLDMPTRTHLNFIGASVIDDAGSDATRVTISGGVGGSADILAVQVFS